MGMLELASMINSDILEQFSSKSEMFKYSQSFRR